jgi:hypothetical protein
VCVGIGTITDSSVILSPSLKCSDYPMAIVDLYCKVSQKTNHFGRFKRKAFKFVVMLQEESEI